MHHEHLPMIKDPETQVFTMQLDAKTLNGAPGTERLFSDFLFAEYQLVYEDPDYRLYATKSVARSPLLINSHHGLQPLPS